MNTSELLNKMLLQDQRRVLILDDDPTGTQTVSDVNVILHPSIEAYRQFFAGNERVVYILTNSRALTEKNAIELVRKIQVEVEKVAQEFGTQYCFLLRGDSTLRGHVFPEIDVFQTEDSVSLFVPAFPEGGRTTVDGIHYLKIGEQKLPVVHTEFAKDPVFGYKSERLVDWVKEVGNGREAITIPLAQIRENGFAFVSGIIQNAPAGSVIIPDAETKTDIEIIVCGLLDAEKRGRKVILRSASTFAMVRTGLQSKMITSIDASKYNRILLVCGSHTAASTRQLEKLTSQMITPVVIPTYELLEKGKDAIVSKLASKLSDQLDSNKFVILQSERIRHPEHWDLEVGAKVMEALTSIVSRISHVCDVVIAKGGITSAQITTDGLSARSARVLGQLEPGVSLWELEIATGGRIPYVVIPGNVGTDDTISNIATLFGVNTRGSFVS